MTTQKICKNFGMMWRRVILQLPLWMPSKSMCFKWRAQDEKRAHIWASKVLVLCATTVWMKTPKLLYKKIWKLKLTLPMSVSVMKLQIGKLIFTAPSVEPGLSTRRQVHCVQSYPICTLSVLVIKAWQLVNLSRPTVWLHQLHQLLQLLKANSKELYVLILCQ